MNNRKLLAGSLFLGLFLFLITEPSFNSFHQGYFTSVETSLLEPLFSTSVSYFISGIILLFFSSKIFKLWLRKIVSWFLPLSLFVIWIGDGGNDIVSPDRTDYAILFGFILVVLTLIFALIQKFKYQR